MDENETKILKHEQILAQYRQWLTDTQLMLADALASNRILNEQLHSGAGPESPRAPKPGPPPTS